MSERTVEYYDRTAADHDALHGGEKNPEHLYALERAWPLLSDCPQADVKPRVLATVDLEDSTASLDPALEWRATSSSTICGKPSSRRSPARKPGRS
jgi:hypothetical protein